MLGLGCPKHASAKIATPRGFVPKLRDQLRILWRTQRYTPHAFAAHPKLKAEQIERISQAMVRIGEDPEGRRLLSSLGFKNGLIQAKDAGWDDVRRLQLEKIQPLQ
ncbi:hypothetical protein BOW53_16315 [Solemya pervernicosa gill symbiont]|uniref:Uncharacterized protein n=1 Tax=Solemya pervernicosa gill symbiont TaxID=642797 RepID=A0A1T2KZD5_9GAMM|nr:PhnD/SsuA/transferrin family substrate-binding protein [Solemya pervernicosa gill symbiont]OOZ38191.1 hypothetical protein BOW53_16315 [Solemya pervernicosa gill symbiont]